MPEGLDAPGLWFVAGGCTAGYGALVLLDVLAHESRLVALGLLVVGIGIVAAALQARQRPDSSLPEASTRARRAATLGLGLFAAGGVLTYNAAVGSALSLPELAILAYGVALVLAAPRLSARLGPVRVDDAVAWSLPLVAAPLGVYALDAVLDAGTGSSPLDAFIRHVLVPPMTYTLDLLGFDVTYTGRTVALGTPRGRLFLTVGLVCAGLQPGVLFLGVLGLHVWREDTPPGRAALLLGLGALSVYLMNLVRLVGLALVGHRWGGAALQRAHAHAGWFLFIALVLAFWGLLLPRLEASDAEPEPA